MAPDLIEVVFPLQGRALPEDYRVPLADALGRVLPWLAQEPGAGVRRLNLVRGGDGELLVSPRTRLVLRVPREKSAEAEALAGEELQVGSDSLHVGAPRVRELLPHGTLYAHLVASSDNDEAAFVARMREELAAFDVQSQPMCGRWQSAEGSLLVGCSVMLAGLDGAQALRVLQHGLGPHRLLGCGVFVAHRSAAAVGTPA